MRVCMCVTNMNTMKKRLNNKSVQQIIKYMLTKYFYRILIMYVWRNVSSHMLVVCFFRWFDEISVVVFEAGASLTVKVEQERK